MIIPTPQYDPLFAEDGVPFRTKMMQFIEEEFGDILDGRQPLVDSERGTGTAHNHGRPALESKVA